MKLCEDLWSVHFIFISVHLSLLTSLTISGLLWPHGWTLWRPREPAQRLSKHCPVRDYLIRLIRLCLFDSGPTPQGCSTFLVQMILNDSTSISDPWGFSFVILWLFGYFIYFPYLTDRHISLALACGLLASEKWESPCASRHPCCGCSMSQSFSIRRAWCQWENWAAVAIQLMKLLHGAISEKGNHAW